MTLTRILGPKELVIRRSDGRREIVSPRDYMLIEWNNPAQFGIEVEFLSAPPVLGFVWNTERLRMTMTQLYPLPTQTAIRHRQTGREIVIRDELTVVQSASGGELKGFIVDGVEYSAEDYTLVKRKLNIFLYVGPHGDLIRAKNFAAYESIEAAQAAADVQPGQTAFISQFEQVPHDGMQINPYKDVLLVKHGSEDWRPPKIVDGLFEW